MSAIYRHVQIAVVLVISAVALAACSTVDSEEDPYAEDFAFALQFATSDFERGVLSDGKITRDEYVEAHDLWLTCMERAFPPGEPFTVQLETNSAGLYSYGIFVPAEAQGQLDEAYYDLIDAGCSTGTIDTIAVLYNGVQTNPQRLPLEQRMVDCLVSAGVLPDDYGADDFRRDYLDGEYTGPLSSDDPNLSACWAEMSGM